MTAPATQQTEIRGPAPTEVKTESRAQFTPPITPMVRSEQPHPFESQTQQSIMPSERDLEQMMKIAEKLASSGFLPARLNTPGKVLATIMTGRELGLPPMLSTRAIRIMKDTGLPIISADVLLGAFKRMGGRAVFTVLTDQAATLQLRHPNGDEHVETFSIADATRAGLLAKSGGTDDSGKRIDNNWQKYPKAMLRSRCITAGLKSVGWEPAAGMYDADEAEEIAASSGFAPSITATVSASGEVQPTDAAQQQSEPAIRIRGVLLDQKKPDTDEYVLALGGLTANMDWGAGKLGEVTGNAVEEAKWRRFIRAIKVEIARRYIEDMIRAEPNGEDAEGAVDQHYRDKLGADRYAGIIARIGDDGVLAPDEDDLKT